MMGRLIATSEPKAIGQHDNGDEDADLLAAGLGVALGVAEAAVVLHLDTGVTGALGGLVGGVELGDLDLLGVVGDGGEGGRAVFAQGGGPRGRRDQLTSMTCSPSASCGDRLLDRRLELRVVRPSSEWKMTLEV